MKFNHQVNIFWNFLWNRWEAENQKHRQRAEPSLEWGEDTDILTRLCFWLAHGQSDSRWPLPPALPLYLTSRCSSSIWRAKLWIPPPSLMWWWKTTRLLGKISECNTAEPAFLLRFGRRMWWKKMQLPNNRLVWTRCRGRLFDLTRLITCVGVDALIWRSFLKLRDCVTAIWTSQRQPPTGLASHHHWECTGKL